MDLIASSWAAVAVVSGPIDFFNSSNPGNTSVFNVVVICVETVVNVEIAPSTVLSGWIPSLDDVNVMKSVTCLGSASSAFSRFSILGTSVTRGPKTS